MEGRKADFSLRGDQKFTTWTINHLCTHEGREGGGGVEVQREREISFCTLL